MSNDFGVDIVGYHFDYGERGGLDLVGLERWERSEELVGANSHLSAVLLKGTET
jgi:hypothetical protein